MCYQLLCTNLGGGILHILSPNHNIHGENGAYHCWTMYTLKSKSVSGMHFSEIWRPKFTDLANSKKINLWEKMTVHKSAWVKTCVHIEGFFEQSSHLHY